MEPLSHVAARPRLSHPPAAGGAGRAAPAGRSFREVLDDEARRSSRSTGAEVALALGEVSAADVPPGRAGLRWAAEQLEARLWAFALKDAFNAENGGLFGDSFAGQVYADWLTEVMATLLVRSGAGQLADRLVEEFEGVAEGVSRPRGNSGVTAGGGP